MVEYEVDDHILIPPNSYVLGRSVEYFRMPSDVLALVVGKSTYARSGIIVNVTPLEPGWAGHVTIEISNATPLPAKVYAHEGIAQVVFLRGEQPDISYADRSGKYQKQEGITLPRL
jgi:dCTP deaminase